MLVHVVFLVFQEVKNFPKHMTVYRLSESKLDLVQEPRFPVDQAKLSGTSPLPPFLFSTPPPPFPFLRTLMNSSHSSPPTPHVTMHSYALFATPPLPWHFSPLSPFPLIPSPPFLFLCHSSLYIPSPPPSSLYSPPLSSLLNFFSYTLLLLSMYKF